MSFELKVLQQPNRARARGIARSFAGRRTIDPPPVVKMSFMKNGKDSIQDNSNHLLMVATAEPVTQYDENDSASARKRKKNLSTSMDLLYGETVISATILNSETGDLKLPDGSSLKSFFVFNDLSIRYEGKFRLVFALYEMQPSTMSIQPKLHLRASVRSEVFTVYIAKEFPGLMPSTKLDQLLKNYGTKVRIRKITGTKRGSSGSRKSVKQEPSKVGKARTVSPGPTPPALIISNLLNPSQQQESPQVHSPINGLSPHVSPKRSVGTFPTLLPSFESLENHSYSPRPSITTARKISLPPLSFLPSKSFPPTPISAVTPKQTFMFSRPSWSSLDSPLLSSVSFDAFSMRSPSILSPLSTYSSSSGHFDHSLKSDNARFSDKRFLDPFSQ